MKRREATAIQATPGEKPTKKNFRLYQSKIDRAKKALRAETETAAIEQALDLVILRDELVSGVRAMKSAELLDVFADEE